MVIWTRSLSNFHIISLTSFLLPGIDKTVPPSNLKVDLSCTLRRQTDVLLSTKKSLKKKTKCQIHLSLSQKKVKCVKFTCDWLPTCDCSPVIGCQQLVLSTTSPKPGVSILEKAIIENLSTLDGFPNWHVSGCQDFQEQVGWGTILKHTCCLYFQ